MENCGEYVGKMWKTITLSKWVIREIAISRRIPWNPKNNKIFQRFSSTKIEFSCFSAK